MKTLLLCFTLLTICGKPKASVAFCTIAFAVVGTQCIKLDGKHYVQMKDSHLLNAISTKMTIEMRIRVSSFTNEWMPILYKGDGISPGSIGRSYTLWVNQHGFMHFTSAPQHCTQRMLNSAIGSIRLKRWYHIALVVDSDAHLMMLYLNGKVVGKNNYTGRIHQSKLPLRIGWTHENNHQYGYFNGMIDGVRIWNVVRTPDEIRSYIRKPLTGKEKGLVGYWPFDDATAKDRTYNDIDGTFKQGVQRPVPKFTSTGRMCKKQRTTSSYRNFHDIGGIKTANGKRLKEGQVYLSGIPPHDTILNMAEDGRIRTVINFLMKWEGKYQRYKWRKSDKLNIVHLPYGWTENPSQWERDWGSRREDIIGQLVLKYSAPIKGTFAVLADEKNYPVMYYCRGGIDRSIIVTGILYLALGVSEEDIFSGHGQFFGARTVRDRRYSHERYILRTAFSYVDKVGGIEKYLKHIGVPDEHVEKFKQNMLR